ncbi:lipopolysaccharide assembly LapA domain-containing protein [Brachybacterium sp. sponge]|uniref:LapA family protein n=1 Tax=Brachybacterium sp. sponge TaxID=1775432 RepID=UPI0007A537F0|nr:lipopolysaccharide assembly protein LapA domain-containing protein [Brachybacterium sp. sponge]
MTAPDDPARTSGPDGAARPADDPTPTPEATRPADPAPTGRRAAERPSSQDPAPQAEEVPSSGGKTATTWIALILGAIVLVLLLIFVIQNNQTAGFEYFSAQFDLPLGVAMLLAAIAGALVMALVGSVRMIQMGWTIRKLRKQQEKVQRSLR